MKRIALYSHDALGLGHLRRNLAIARALADGEDRCVLVVTGTREAAAFPLPAGVDVLTLPSFAKRGAGAYGPRTLRTSAARLRSIRAQTMRAALVAFMPDALIVDKHPLGLEGELEPALERLAACGTRFVLGLRDVLDEPGRAQAEWRAACGPDLVRELYDDLWVYGDPEVYDLVHEVGLGLDAERKASYTGYLGRTDRAARGAQELRAAGVPPGPLDVCLVGGGEDGYELAASFLHAAAPRRRPAAVLTGPMMPREQRARLRRLAGRRAHVIDFLADPGALLRRAEGVVAMGGYNTVCELLALGKRPLLVPRTTPRQEQLIRARRLASRGVVDVLEPQAAEPQAIAAWLGQPRPATGVAGRVDLGGLRRIPRLVERVLEPRLARA